MTELWPTSLGEGAEWRNQDLADIRAGHRGVSDLWTNVNHIAIVVSNVGTSLSFYTDVVGMKQVLRPDFDRHGAWLTFGNVDLHLIKGKPAVHSDDDLIVSHIAISVPDMGAMFKKLKELNTKYRFACIMCRINISVPNPDSAEGRVEQAFVRDPDGYYIEFCDCEKLDKFLHSKVTQYQQKWDFFTTATIVRMGPKLRTLVLEARTRNQENICELVNGYPDDIQIIEEAEEADPKVLEKMITRRKIYGDIVQNVDLDELEALLRHFNNNVPKVIGAIECKVLQRGTRTFIPPAFYARDGTFYQPPAFEMPCTF